MRVLAIDYGAKRVGIATSDEGRSFAFPRATFVAGPGLIPSLVALCAREDVGEVVVGWPRSLAGTPNAQTSVTGVFVEELRRALAVPVRTVDERFSTQGARRKLAETGSCASLDAAAAVTILESYLRR